MGKVIKITESQLRRIIDKVINEGNGGIRVSSDTIRKFLKNYGAQVNNGTYRVVRENGQKMVYIEYKLSGGGKGMGSVSHPVRLLDKVVKPDNLTKENGTWNKYSYTTPYGPEIELN